MRFVCALITVDDVKRSREFYENLLDQKVQADYGANVLFEGGFAIHHRSHFEQLLGLGPIGVGSNSFELYFEHDELESFLDKLQSAGVDLIHGIREQPWGQLVVRFFDPDKNIVEVGESMERLVLRMAALGRQRSEIAEKTGLSESFVARVTEEPGELA